MRRTFYELLNFIFHCIGKIVTFNDNEKLLIELAKWHATYDIIYYTNKKSSKMD